ncbi:hypothetical protein Ccrd_013268 [Cynara cardunculus var. scolymus]|uniref:Uncharacterized protein n=1 Tax=Cynara cardunculus var. scolymus TaxID=59895 RepID=A0A103YFX6_CYNCS|nr:hypothetical protein Ccrd_013268 [Cynara cardunculus var. scolymus]
MVFNTMLISSVATVSADVWQSVACVHDRISSRELLDLVIVFPLQQLGRLAHCIWTCFCVPPSPTDSYHYSYAYHDVDSDTDSDSYMSFSGGEEVFEYGYSYSDSHSD